MKKTITIYCLLFFIAARAQVFTGTGGAISDNGQDAFFPLAISTLNPSQIDSTFGLEQVCINITHPDVRELYISLQSPSGTLVELSAGSSVSGPDYINTCFDSGSGNSITLTAAPFTGVFKPVGYLGRFNTGQAGNGTWNLIVHDGFPGSNAGTVMSWTLQFGSVNPAPPVLLQSSNLPIVFVNSTQPIGDFSITASMGIIDNGANRNNFNDPKNGYNGNIGIHVRGSSSKNYPKKCYSVELHDATAQQIEVPILGMPAESDWVLCASYADKTLLRNNLTFDLFRSMGHYSPRYRNVELVLNNEYYGVYGMLEKPKRNQNRIDIEKLDNTENTMPYVSGGYIIKIDRTDEPGWYSSTAGNVTTGAKFYYQYDYPKPNEITSAQISYIQTFMTDFENLMNSSTYADPINGYAKYIDVNSFVDYFIINELSRNVDAYRLSTYLVKESVIKSGKLSIGPVWDYDLAWHNANYGYGDNPAGWAFQLEADPNPVPTWWIRFMQDSGFVNAVYCRWKLLRQNVLDINNINTWIDNNAAAISEGVQRNFRFWPIMGAYIFPNPQSQAGANYSTEIADLKSWVANRISWLDANITGKCAVGILENNVLVSNVNVYPNPFQQKTTFYLELAHEADVSLCITDVAGKELARYLNSKVPQGENNIVIDRNKMEAGIYFYQLQVDNAIRTGKIIIQ